MDPNLPVLLMLSGDDRLENLFGRVRMQGAHNCHVDIKTLMERLAAAMDLCRLFTIHPSWDEGHRRLNYSWLEHCDHLKPSAWKGHLIARSCDPKVAWSAGCAHAEEILQAHHVSTDFTEVFSHPNIDMLRPFPDGIYPGISTDADPSMSAPPKSHPVVQHKPVNHDGDEEYEDEIDDEMDVNIDDILDEPPAPAELQHIAGDDWLKHEENKYHKASLLLIIFCSDFVRKSKERLECVRAFTTKFQHRSKEESDEALIGVSLFVKLGDLFATLIRTGRNVALGVLQATSIEHKSRKVSAISAAELSVEEADIKVSGQVLHVIAHSSSSQHSGSSYEPATLFAPSDMSLPEHSSPKLAYSSDIAHNAAILTAQASISGIFDPSAPILHTANQSPVAVPDLFSG
jgi:hypothetical protein